MNRRLVASTSVCLMALVLVSAAPANAERSSGRCTFKGSAFFSPTDLKPLPTEKLAYEFEGPAECERLPSRESLNGVVRVTGAETLSCSGALGGSEGKGTLTLGGVELHFGLTFFGGSPGSTMLVATFSDGGEAVGGATFLASSFEPAAACFTAKSGVHTLEFTAVASGEL
jgi:hypothetical protein